MQETHILVVTAPKFTNTSDTVLQVKRGSDLDPVLIKRIHSKNPGPKQLQKFFKNIYWSSNEENHQVDSDPVNLDPKV